MSVNDSRTEKSQSLKLENCKNLYLSGVREVTGFDDTSLSLATDFGMLEIRGRNIKVVSFDAATGDMAAEGYIYALVYTESGGNKGFFKRIFS